MMAFFLLRAGRPVLTAAIGWLALSPAVQAATLQVGPGKQYATPCAAFAAASSGDTIEIDAVTYSGDVCLIYPSNLTIRGVGGRAKIDAAGRNAASKGTWVIEGNNTDVENIELANARLPSPDLNGSGIRLDGNGLTVRNCYFHDNDDGILTNNNHTNEILIEYSEFDHNGAGDGQSHNMYIGEVAMFTLRYCYSHRAVVGHLVKSRSALNYILYNRLSDEADGTASYELDLPVAGESYVIGNSIEQGPNTQNSTILTYREEVNAPFINSSDHLFVINNTFVNDLPNRGTFININSTVQTPAVITNNIFVGPGTVKTQASAVMTANLVMVTQDPLFKDKANYDYHLTYQSPAIDAGADPGTGDGYALAPTGEYVHPACGEGRQTVGKIDIGAYEFLGATFNPDAPPGCSMITPGGIVNIANFQAGPLAPGSILSIFGSNLATSAQPNPGIPLPLSIVGTSVTVNGTPAPLFYVSPSQINVQVPFEAAPGPASAVVAVGSVQTAPTAFTIAATAPAILVYGDNRAIAENDPSKGLSLNGPQAPAAPGDVVTVFMIGQGAVVNPPVATGAAALADPLSRVAQPYSATVGGDPATLNYLGLTPTLVGVLQANVVVPPLTGRKTGDYPVVVTVGGVASNAPLLSVALP